MGRKTTDQGATLREAIALILSDAPNPLTAAEIASNPLLQDLGFTTQQVRVILGKAMERGNSLPCPLRRVPAPPPGRWAYYRPDYHPQLEDKPRPAPTPAPAPAPEEHSEEPYKFDPLPEALMPPPPAPSSTVVIPSHVKSITLEVGGVRLTIELDSLAGHR